MKDLSLKLYNENIASLYKFITCFALVDVSVILPELSKIFLFLYIYLFLFKQFKPEL